MYFILKGDDCQFYLLPYTTYILGRQEADILIAEDDSVSHRHAVLVATDEEVSIADVSSEHGTFVNQIKLKPLDTYKLNDNDTLKFGNQTIFRFQKVTIINTSSGLKSGPKRRLKHIMARMGGVLIGKWTRECNFVTVTEIIFSIKVLSAVIIGTPIVTLQYWKDYLQCLKSNKPLPDPLRYFPKYSENLIDQNISLKYKEERKNVFKNKIFIFTNRNDKEMIEPLIKLAGGDTQFWDEEPVTTVKIRTSVYILLKADDLKDTMRQDKKLSNFVDNFLSEGYRTVPYNEIAFAIVDCTCEKYCNPIQLINFNDEIISISDSDSNDNENNLETIHTEDTATPSREHQSLNNPGSIVEIISDSNANRHVPISHSASTQTNTTDEGLNSSAVHLAPPPNQIHLPD